ncbi:MAG: PmoA family protein [Candidatus Hydrogenedentes bacterium]|nr:PmoA family protein [Candidatus Hydrogenedentota bacterium]
MRFSLYVGLALLVAVVPLAGAEGLATAKITLKAGDHKVLNPPISLPYGGPELDGHIVVEEAKTGKHFPVTVRNGEFVFIPEGAMPGTTHTYSVRVEKKDPTVFPRVQVKQQGDKPILDVLIDDVHFTSYHYSNDWKKPFLWPVNSEGQIGVTRNFPMGEQESEKGKDHPHHKSFYAAYGEITLVGKAMPNDKPADCWAEGKDSGFQHSDEVTWGSGDAYGWVKAKNTWQDKDHRALLTEEREYRFYATPEKGRLVDAFLTFTADYGDVLFSDTKEGGMVAIRMRPELSYDNAVITNAQGDVGEANLWGKPSPWCDYSGNMDGVGWRGLTVFDHPANLRYPTSWHVRGYGLMGANPFGYSYFGSKDHNKGLLPMENGDYTIKNKESLSFKHRVYVHSGDVKKAAVADRYADFATPPEVEWVE